MHGLHKRLDGYVTSLSAFVLVTGGAGFIGSHLVERLVAEGARVCILDNFSSGKWENIVSWKDRVEVIQGDIQDIDTVKKAVKGVDYILHQAALRSVPKSMAQPQEYHDVNVTGLLNLLLAAKEAKIRKFVFASSSSIYGDVTQFPQKEGEEAEPISPYAITKRLGEQYLRLFSKIYNIQTVSLRYFNVFGPRQSLDDEYAVVIPKFITCLFQKQSPPIYGDGTQSRDFTYVSNVVDANLAAIHSNVGSGEIINVACGKDQTISFLAKTVAELVNASNIKPIYLPKRPGDVHKTQADTTRLETLLGVNSQVSFVEGLKRTIQWFQKECPSVLRQLPLNSNKLLDDPQIG
ncbi:MAG: SDR family oxidoreductase [Deltaproteobacteria bacterium]|nr:SDR family oxidoreductase [Deltaproteobacteria bacterium]